MGIPVTVVKKRKPNIFHIDKFRGINKNITYTQIEDNESPDMLNFQLDDAGALDKRFGYSRVFDVSLGVGAINGVYDGLYDGKIIFAHGTKLYSQTGSDAPAEIQSGLTSARNRFFTLGTNLYIMNGYSFNCYNGTTIVDIAANPYIPTLTMGRTPAGGGTAFEQWNLLGAGFKDSFSSDGVATTYTLSITGLDATLVTVLYNGVAKTELTHFTVNRTTGVINFAAGTSPLGAPAEGTNNVVITAYKTQAFYSNRIRKCTIAVQYGGDNDTRLFVSGNPDYPNMIWRSGLLDKGANPNYFPENDSQQVGVNTEKVMNFSKQYDTLVIHKEHSTYQMLYNFNDGDPIFPIKPINDAVGCYAVDSVQLLNNTPVTLDRTGIYNLAQSNVRDERNMQSIGENIDKTILAESNIQNAVSIDYENKYFLAINGNCYIYDYLQGVWYPWDNINASCFFQIAGRLYFGSDSEGLLYKFKQESESRSYIDDTVAINAYWKSKLLTYNADEFLKTVNKLFFGVKRTSKSSLTVYYSTNKEANTLAKDLVIRSFDFRTLDFSKFSFLLSRFPTEVMAKIRAKKITHLQITIENNGLDEGLSVLSIGTKYDIKRLVK